MSDDPIQMRLSHRDAQFDPCGCGENRWQMVADVDVDTMDTTVGAVCVGCGRRYGDRHGQ